ncbi:MAG: type II secretion system F family protein [Ignisphaera sp.]
MKRRTPTVGEVFTALSLSFFESWGRALAKTFELNKAIDRAGLSIHPVKYAASTIALTLFTALFTTLTIVLIYIFAPPPLPYMVIAILIAIVLPIVVFSYRLSYPGILASMRRAEVENELPFFMAYISTMVRGGYSFEKVIERVAHLKIFRGIRREAQRIMTRIRMFGDDPLTALEYVAIRHPSTRFRDLMLGYTTTLRSGGDVVHYLEIRTRELFESRTNEIKAIMGRLASYLEVYTIFGVIVSVTLFVFFAVSGAITAAQAARSPGEIAIAMDITMPSLYNFLVLPLMGIAIAFAIHLNQPRTPVNYGRAYATFITFIPISIAAFVVALVATGGMDLLLGVLNLGVVKSVMISLAVAILTLSLPPWLVYRAMVKGYRGIVRATADFLRDLSEVRKTGLAPEKCIVMLSARDYRMLSPIVTRAAAALSIGFSLEDALRRALRGVKEWFVVASLRFLADSVVVGGGSPEVVDVLARFTQILSELEEETRRRMRTQVILPYFGAVMLATMPIIILYMLLTMANISLATATPLLFVMGIGNIVNSYIMGLIAGKSSQATIAAGFLHAAILSTLSATALIATLTYLGA